MDEKQIKSNYDFIVKSVDTHLPDRADDIKTLFSKYEERFMLAPASTNKSNHGCFPGGLVNHIKHVIDISVELYDTWKKLGYEMNFTLSEVIFCAIFHDFGKLGNETTKYYIDESSEWHRNKLGRFYKINPEISFMKVTDRSLFILNQENIPYSTNEFYGIKLAYGLFDKTNESYLLNYFSDYDIKTDIHILVHHADQIAMRLETQENSTTPVSTTTTSKKKQNEGGRPSKVSEFKGVFESDGSKESDNKDSKTKPKSTFTKDAFDDLFS